MLFGEVASGATAWRTLAALEEGRLDGPGRYRGEHRVDAATGGNPWGYE
ncbi:MAG: hypothetical protein H0U00_03405 [Actinobacteria bacterium]|nr:hypothetical protein [Actinomycetota bacterium]